MPEAPRKVKFVYSRAADYRVIPATGVYGGPTPSGNIKMNFMVESATEPTSATHTVAADGTLGDEVEREPAEKTITRELQVGIVMNVEAAETFVKWLTERISIVRKVRAKKGS